MLIPHKGHTDTIQVYSVTVMTHVRALQPGHSSQGTSEPITPDWICTRTIGSYCLLCLCLFCVCSRGGSTNLWWVEGLSHVFSVSSGGLLAWGHFG